MIAKLSGKAAVLLFGGLMLVFGLCPESLAAQELYLSAGTTATVDSSQATCVHAISAPNPPSKGVTDSGCSGNAITMYLFSGSPVVPQTVHVLATSELDVQFQVDTQSGAPGPSVLPVLIAVPVSWKGGLDNDSLIPPSNVLASAGAYVNVNASLRLLQGQAGNPGASQDQEVNSNRFMGSTNAGISGCFTSVPGDLISAALMLANCTVGIFQRNQGNGTIYVSGLIQTGQTYEVRLELDGEIYTLAAGGAPPLHVGNPLLNFEDNPLTGQPDSSFGLAWTGPMTITIGTDFQSRIADLQNQINQLTSSLNKLRYEFLHHTHVYLTGKGVGQNNTKVMTGPPVLDFNDPAVGNKNPSSGGQYPSQTKATTGPPVIPNHMSTPHH